MEITNMMWFSFWLFMLMGNPQAYQSAAQTLQSEGCTIYEQFYISCPAYAIGGVAAEIPIPQAQVQPTDAVKARRR